MLPKILVLLLFLPQPAFAEETFDECISKIKRKTITLRYGLKMRNIHNGVSKDVNKCAQLLPEDEREDQEDIKTVTLVTKPRRVSGSRVSDAGVVVGVAANTDTGPQLVFSTNAALDFPRDAIFSISDGATLRLLGLVKFGVPEQSLDGLHTKITLSRDTRVDLDRARQDKKTIEKLLVETDEEDAAQAEAKQITDDAETYLAGLSALSISPIISLTFDRDLSIQRPWDAYVGAGLGASAGARKKALDLNLTVEAGAGETGGTMAPYLRLNIGGDGYLCTSLSSGNKHLFCVTADGFAKAGLLQSELGVGVGAEYRYVRSSTSDKIFNWLSIGPHVGSQFYTGPGDDQATGEVMFGATVK